MLLELAGEMDGEYGCEPWADRIREIVETAMFRRSTKSRAPVKRRKVTARIRDRVKEDYYENPSDSCDEIGLRYKIDGGRVSEIINGQHDDL